VSPTMVSWPTDWFYQNTRALETDGPHYAIIYCNSRHHSILLAVPATTEQACVQCSVQVTY